MARTDRGAVRHGRQSDPESPTELHALFVEVTGVSTITERQHSDSGTRHLGDHALDDDVASMVRTTGLEDTIDTPDQHEDESSVQRILHEFDGRSVTV